MPTPVREPAKAEGDPGQNGAGPPQPAQTEESLGAQLLREASEGHDVLVAGWNDFMKALGISGKPIGAKELRAMMIREGINPNTSEFSREIIAMREFRPSALPDAVWERAKFGLE